MKARLLLLAACAALLSACAPHAWVRQPAPALPDSLPAIRHSLLLIGDCGKPAHDPEEPSLALLRSLCTQLGPDATALFLGDNAYDRGLPAPGHPDRAEMERRLSQQARSVSGTGARAFMIPGNHDWDMQGPGGWEAVQREEAYMEAQWPEGNSFRPDGGCPGPSTARLAPGLTLVMLDSQWWMHRHEKPGTAQGCAASDEDGFIQALRDTLAAHAGDRLVVAAHHPVWTYGTHGGRFGPKYHLFPLLMAKKTLFIPLPVLGTLAVLFRKVVGSDTDCAHPRYRRYRKELREVFAAHPGLVYVAGHEHNLQYSREGAVHHVVSGSGSKSQSVGHGRHAQYTRGAKGLARLDLLEDGRLLLRFLLPQGGCTVDYGVVVE